MKRVLLCLCLVAAFTSLQAQNKKETAKKETVDKSKDNVDDRMKGPNGEKIFIGPNGGRYYLKDGKKVYVEYKGNKKKKG